MSERQRPDGYDALPARFKKYIDALERQVNGLLASRPSATATDIKVVNYDAKSGEETYLPTRTRLDLTLRLPQCVEQPKSRSRAASERHVQVYISKDGESVELYGEDALCVLPDISNVVRIQPRWRP